MAIGTMTDKDETSTDYPLAHSVATKMLAAGLERVQSKTGMTQRDIAKKLDYKTSVVLSHMGLGRVPIPIDKAEQIAHVLGLDRATFLLATLEQRHPEVDFEGLFGVQLPQASTVAAELEAIAGSPLDSLEPSTIQVLREVVASADPIRRWVTPAELPTLEAMRKSKSPR